MISYIFVGVGSIVVFISILLHLPAWQWLTILEITGFGSNLAFILPVFVGRVKVLQELTSWIATSLPILSWVCIISDVLLLIIVASLLILLWGNTNPLTWRMIATSSFSFYIADMWFKYAIKYLNYVKWDILEVFWVSIGFLFRIGAVLELKL
ncbi:hypothetical protein RINTHM_9450 [Richelia intracellularis HM01]|uniref:hypothetical protein n=1 Tax=Richelia intracellularis TaxID=1164990 RepID=UPI0002B5F8C0|nr:hypothetical protein [Richelia intracellularis]CCH65406.1 hypothetical protein RINTHM_9450 [Richelia intracellularis HM01]